jgi:glycosyltransferase involved in cell wall biosynthesis
MSDAVPGKTVFAVIAAYNEETALGPVIDGLRPVVDRVVVVDDGSRDATAATAFARGADTLIHRINLGQGAALQTGILYALRNGADLIATFDADGQHDAADIPRLAEALAASGAEIALGSRFLGATEMMPWQKRLLLRAATVFTRATTGLRVSDAHNGIRLMTRRAATAIGIRQNRMAHASEILHEIARSRLPYVEAPVRIRYTEYSIAKGQRLSGAFEIVFDLINGRIFKR